jgi:protein tyrosine phosphatase
MADFQRAVGLSHWIDVERQLENEYLALLNRAFKVVNMNAARFSQYMPRGAKTEQCRPGLTSIQPWTCTRVKLLEHATGVPNDEDPSFVNASYMGEHGFIGAGMPQGDAAREAFWRCCFEQKVRQIIMLNLPSEQSNMPYWPHEVTRGGFKDLVDEPRRYGNFLVRVAEVITRQRPEIVHRRFRVEYAPQPECGAPGSGLPPAPVDGAYAKRRIWTVEQHCYLSWPDMSVPENKAKFVTFVEDVLRLRKLHKYRCLVHCMGGAGRTGSFLTIAHVMLAMDAYKRGLISELPTVSDIILELRKHRDQQVQTEIQFKLCTRIVSGFVFPVPKTLRGSIAVSFARD